MTSADTMTMARPSSRISSSTFSFAFSPLLRVIRTSTSCGMTSAFNSSTFTSIACDTPTALLPFRLATPTVTAGKSPAGACSPAPLPKLMRV